MYEKLKPFTLRPDAWSEITTRGLWTRPHIADRMLSCHLDQGTPLASRPEAEIAQIVDSLDSELALRGKRICDLGCGPGLYARRFAELGATVTGVDISETSIGWARHQQSTNDNDLKYVVADYLRDSLGDGFDVVTLIYFDFCALAPADRSALLGKIHAMLRPGGFLVFDVVSENALRGVEESLSIEDNLMDGFWSASAYVGIHRKWVYNKRKLTLDHFGIFERDRHFEIFNWMQFFSEERVIGELTRSGFTVVGLHGSLNLNCSTGPSDSAEIGVIARK